MKKIVCELCEGTEFTKENGMFVCMGCGTKYSAEEARSMMREVEGDAAVPAGSPVVGAPVGNPNQQQVDNLLLLATNAYSASNNEETEKYCNRAIELDATCYKAWMLKGKAVGWQTTIKNSRVAEAAHSFKQAVDFAPDEEKENLSEEAAEELKRLGLACISLRQKRFSQYPDKEELNGFVSDMEPLIDGLIVLLPKSNDVLQLGALLGGLGRGVGPLASFLAMQMKAITADVPKDFFSQIAIMMNNAAIEGYKTTTKKYNNDRRPMPDDFNKTMNEVDNCITLLDMAIHASDDDGDDDISRYNSMITMQEYVIEMDAYADYSSSYRSWELTSSSKNARKNTIAEYKEKIQEIRDKAKAKAEEERKKAEEEKQERIKAYWEAHADEKATLDAEKKQLSDKKANLDTKIAEFDKSISACKDVEKAKVPSEEETDKLNAQIKELEDRKSKLGMFAGKEKKQIGEEIASLQGRIESLKEKITAEKKVKSEEVQKKIAPMQKERDELDAERTKVTKRIAAIDAELTKDPEA